MSLLLLGACGRAVPLDPPRPGPQDAEICAAIQARLPDRVAGEYRLSVSPDVANTAAWGSPAITWRCGVPQPDAYEPTASVLNLDEVLWFPQRSESGVRYTSVQQPHIEIEVPSLYPDPASVLKSLSPSLRAG